MLEPVVIPTRARGRTVLDVVEGFNADPTGVRESTAAFQAAIEALPAKFGGTVHVPAGTYLIDPTERVRLRSLMCLDLDPQAYLVAKPNAAREAFVLWAVDLVDVEIVGGNIQGDRLTHTYTVFTNKAYNTHEWNHGIKVTRCKRVTINGTRITECAGDGLSIGGEDIVLNNVESTHNRRQGLTIGAVRQMRVYNSRLSFTGKLGTNLGTNPRAGIDIEPDAGRVDDVLIQACTLEGNEGGATITIWTRKGTGCIISDVRIRGCTIIGGPNGVQAKANGTDTRIEKLLITGNTIQAKNSGVRIDTGVTTVTVGGKGDDANTFSLIGKPRTPFDTTGPTTKTKYDIYVPVAGPQVTQLLNHFK